jgi:hypothetical protein
VCHSDRILDATGLPEMKGQRNTLRISNLRAALAAK